MKGRRLELLNSAQMPVYELLGVRVNALTLYDLQYLVKKTIASSDRVIIAHHNLHSAYIHHRDPRMRQFFERASVAHVDGMPIVLAARLAGLDLRREHRVTYVDWIGPLLDLCSTESYRVMSLGGTPEAASAVADVVRQRYPELQFLVENGYFNVHPDSDDNRRILETINRFRPNVLIVGMGMPRQEKWILDNVERIDANVILPAGACMDYVAGVVPTPPRWAGRVGLEWAFRLVADPKRLSKRYLVEPWVLLPLLLGDVIRYRFRRPT